MKRGSSPAWDHFCQPIQGGIRVGTPQRFNKSADGIVMGIAVPIVEHRPSLNALLGHRHVDHNRPLIIGGEWSRQPVPAR